MALQTMANGLPTVLCWPRTLCQRNVMTGTMPRRTAPCFQDGEQWRAFVGISPDTPGYRREERSTPIQYLPPGGTYETPTGTHICCGDMTACQPVYLVANPPPSTFRLELSRRIQGNGLPLALPALINAAARDILQGRIQKPAQSTGQPAGPCSLTLNTTVRDDNRRSHQVPPPMALRISCRYVETGVDTAPP